MYQQSNKRKQAQGIGNVVTVAFQLLREFISSPPPSTFKHKQKLRQVLKVKKVKSHKKGLHLLAREVYLGNILKAKGG